MKEPHSELRSVVRLRARRRHRAEAVRLALRLLAPAILLLTLAAVGVMTRLVSTSSTWLVTAVVLVLLAVPAAALVRAFRPVNMPVEAKHLDDTLALKDRLTSALTFSALPHRTAFQQAAVLDAEAHLDVVRSCTHTRIDLRKPVVTLLVAAVSCILLMTVAWVPRPAETTVADDRFSAERGQREDAPREDTPSSPDASTDRETTDETGLEEVKTTTLADEAAASAFTDAELKELDAMRASETADADRLLAQAAYLDESDLSDAGLDKRTATDDDRVTMKEPDMDMIREMVKEAQERKKKGEDGEGGEDIKLEVLIKSHAAASTKRPSSTPGQQSSGSAGGPSQDTRIKPRRILELDKVAFKITSVRSLTPAGTTGGKRIVLSEAIMRTSGAEQPFLAASKDLVTPTPAERAGPIYAQAVPAELRELVSKYFEGLKQLRQAP